MTPDLSDLVESLCRRGARFAYLFGSRAAGSATPESDVDVAAHFGGRYVDPLTVDGVDFETIDLVILDSAPLELAGRVALEGELLFEVDAAERVEWEATTRKIYFDERPRMEQAWRDFHDAMRRRVGRS